MRAKPIVISTWPSVWPESRRRKSRSMPMPISATATAPATSAARRDEIAEGVPGGADRVGGEGPEVACEGVGGALARFGRHALAVAEPSEEVRERAARVGQADLELRVAIEDPAEDEVRGRD